MNRQKGIGLRLTHRAFFESCERGFLIAPISMHRLGDKKATVYYIGVQSYLQALPKNELLISDLSVAGHCCPPSAPLRVCHHKDRPSNLFACSWCPPVEQVKLGKEPHCSGSSVCGFLCVVLALVALSVEVGGMVSFDGLCFGCSHQFLNPSCNRASQHSLDSRYAASSPSRACFFSPNFPSSRLAVGPANVSRTSRLLGFVTNLSRYDRSAWSQRMITHVECAICMLWVHAVLHCKTVVVICVLSYGMMIMSNFAKYF